MRVTRITLNVAVVATLTMLGSASYGGTIVPYFADGDALVQFSGGVGGSATNTSGDLATGVTLAVAYTPTTTDVNNSVSHTGSGAPGHVALLEIGRADSGSGLYIVNGAYWFTTSTGASTAASPVSHSVSDLDGSIVNPLATPAANPLNFQALAVRIGDVVIDGAEDEVWASFDPDMGLVKASLNGVETNYNVTGVGGAWNWEGNGEINYIQYNAAAAERGGLAINGSAPEGWRAARSNVPTGVATLGQYFNLSIPEPTTALLAVAPAVAMLLSRHRRACK